MIRADEELKDRVEARKHELLAKFNQLKADTRRDAAEVRARVKTQLDELELHLKGGWDKLSEAVRAKLGSWLESDRD
jgi:cell division septum initiation protein DivIVA